MRVLVIEDKRVLCDTIAQGLRREGMAIDVAYDGGEGQELTTANQYDVIILDRDLPVIHGDELCRELAGGTTRILMLTASGTIDNRVDGLNLGADDYLPKPFAFPELVARVRALGRRTGPALPPVLSRRGLTLDPARREVVRSGHFVHLTKKEFGVLQVLMAADGSIISAEQLLERVWDENADPFTNSVRVVIATLRQKLGSPPVIETIHGSGYRL
jgi:DNA-binding response OmpR family regulator